MDVASGPSYVHGASPVPLLGETIGQNLDRTAARVPDNDALVSVHQGVRLTYAELHAAVEEVARGLLALGVEPGERVGIWSPNNAERATGDELRDWCRGKIATFKIPRYWRFVDEFPMTVTGKVQKFKMREASVAELGLEDAAGTTTA